MRHQYIVSIVFLTFFLPMITIAAALPRDRFDIATVKAGKIVAGMKVKSVKKYDNTLPLMRDNYKITFSGRATITGTYDYNGDDVGFYSNTVCFSNFDAASEKKIPAHAISAQEQEKYRAANFTPKKLPFCFSNQSVAKKAFGPKGSSGKATIVIDNYIAQTNGGELHDSATFVRVIRKKQARPTTTQEIKTVVDRYLHYTLGAIPGAKIDYVQAKKYLTADLAAQFKDLEFVPKSYCIQDGPDDVMIKSVVFTDDNATAEVDAKYAQDWLKAWKFSLVKQDKSWKIKSIQCLWIGNESS